MSHWKAHEGRVVRCEGPCALLSCLEAGPHEHPICPTCRAVSYGNAFCEECRSHWPQRHREYMATLYKDRRWHEAPLQALFAYDRWRVLCICILLAGTRREQVEKVLYNLWTRWPDAATLKHASPEEVVEVIRSVGWQNRKARFLILMSVDYDRGVAPELMTGVGRYALDSLAIFCDGDTHVSPDDTVLRDYLRSRREGFHVPGLP